MTKASTLPKALIFTALRVEYLAVRQRLSELEEITHKSSIYEHGRYHGQHHDWDVWVVETGKGNNRASTEVERGLHFVDPAVTFFVGIAGGIKDVRLGDVVVATKVYGYESGKATEDFEPRPELFQANDMLVNRARVQARSSEWFSVVADERSLTPQVFVEPIAAGEKVVASTKSDTYAFIRQYYGDAVAVEMEGHGHMLAAHANETPALVVRGISDLLNNKRNTDRAGWQERASANASAFTFSILRKIDKSILKSGEPTEFNISWDSTHLLLNNLQRKIENSFAPDVVITMSGPGSFAACYCMGLNLRDIPVLFATTFPRRDKLNTSHEKFRSIAIEAGWVHLLTDKWDVYLPNIVTQLPEKSKILLFDDRVITGETQRTAKLALKDYGYDVRCAAMLVGDDIAAEIDFIGRIVNDDYYMPWGSKHGRS